MVQVLIFEERARVLELAMTASDWCQSDRPTAAQVTPSWVDAAAAAADRAVLRIARQYLRLYYISSHLCLY